MKYFITVPLAPKKKGKQCRGQIKWIFATFQRVQMQDLDAALFNDIILQRGKLLQSATTQDTRKSSSEQPKQFFVYSCCCTSEAAAGCEHHEGKSGQKKNNKRTKQAV